jgi:hypothetical protein
VRAICVIASTVSAIGTSRYLLRDIQPWLAAVDVERGGKLTVKARFALAVRGLSRSSRSDEERRPACQKAQVRYSAQSADVHAEAKRRPRMRLESVQVRGVSRTGNEPTQKASFTTARAPSRSRSFIQILRGGWNWPLAD